jgi:hypothetical protein
MAKALIPYFTVFLAMAAHAAPGVAEVEALIARQTNEFRAEQGRAKLAADPALTRAARDFADFMARTDRYGHNADGREPADRARAKGYDYCMVSENIAHQASTEPIPAPEIARGFMEGWKASPGHRRNMLEPAVTDAGMAVARSAQSGRYYAVQVFGRSRSRMLEFRVTNAADRPIEYRVSGKAWRLQPSEGRIHTSCVAPDVSFPAAENGKGRTIRPSGGENLVARGTTRLTVDVR